ncbi:MAG TPA: hypothetical protein VF518_02760, partial [Polyangia bacterium]
MKLLGTIAFLLSLFCLLPRTAASEPRKPAQGSHRFVRTAEPREHAFTLLVPKGWQVEGGIFRVNPMQAGGPANAMEAKCDLAVKSDGTGSTMIRFLPKMIYADGPMVPGMFGPGSNYNGMQVVAMPSVEGYLQWLLRTSRPQATGVKIVQYQDRRDLAQAIQKAAAPLNAQVMQVGQRPMTFQAGALVVEYSEGGTRYKEALFTILGDWRASAASWWNDLTITMRAPAAEAERWKSVLDIIRNSIEMDARWVAGEAKGQGERCEIVQKTMEHIRKIDREIAENRSRTRSAIQND